MRAVISWLLILLKDWRRKSAKAIRLLLVCKRKPPAIAAHLYRVSFSTLKLESARRSLTLVAVATTTISARKMNATWNATVCKDLSHHHRHKLIHSSMHLLPMQVIINSSVTTQNVWPTWLPIILFLSTLLQQLLLKLPSWHGKRNAVYLPSTQVPSAAWLSFRKIIPLHFVYLTDVFIFRWISQVVDIQLDRQRVPNLRVRRLRQNGQPVQFSGRMQHGMRPWSRW